MLAAALLLSLLGPASPRLSEVRYDMDLAVDYREETLSGDARLTIRNDGAAPADEVPLLLYRMMTVSSATDAAGRDLPFVQDLVPFEDYPILQVNAVTVRLREPLAPGAETTLRLAWSGYLRGYAEAMGYVRDRIDSAFTILRTDTYAYPEIGVPSVAALRSRPLGAFGYRVRVTVPDSLERDGRAYVPVVANGGRLVSRTESDGRIVYAYENVRPAWRMDFAIGDYAVLGDDRGRVFHFPEDSAGAARALAAMRSARALYARWFGPLADDPGYAVIEIPDGMGSQADVSSVIQTAAAFRDPTRLRELYHEISHLWNAPAADLPSPRWNEGLATYLEYLAADSLDGAGSLRPRLAEVLAGLRERIGKDPDLAAVPMVDYGRRRMTDASYRVGMVFFALLRDAMGPAAFRRMVGEDYRRYRESGGTTRDLADVAEAAGGPGVERIFEEWMFTPAWAGLVRDGAGYDDLLARYRPR